MTPTDDGVRLELDGETHRLDRAVAAELGEALAAALVRRVELFRTAGERRADGTYVVSRLGADSSGHRKVFDGFEAVESLYEGLPAEFTAEDVDRAGLSGGRRHMLVRHLAEHPAFDCELVSRQPLTARKTGGATATGD